MPSLQSTKLLILDNIGLKSYTLEESRDILEIAESRYNKAFIILSGPISHTKWYNLFPDPTIADAIMDRVIHNSYILAFDSKISMREVMAERTIKNLEKSSVLSKIKSSIRCPNGSGLLSGCLRNRRLDTSEYAIGTEKQFDVSWISENKEVDPEAGYAYTPVGGELSKPDHIGNAAVRYTDHSIRSESGGGRK